MFHPSALDPLVILVGIAIAVVIFYYLIRWIRHTLGSMGLSPGEIAVIIWATLVGSLINIPLIPFGEGFIGINVGGAVVPIVLSVYLIRKKGLPFNEFLIGVILVALVSFLVTDYVPGVGVIAEFPWWLLPPFTAFLVAAFAYWHERPSSAALAYVSGTLGTLLGADIVRLPQILSGPAPEAVNGQAPILAIGGAGVFDMVFLAGILAVTMETGLLVRARENLVSGGDNPIDEEYEAWVRKKEKEGEENRRKYNELRRQRKEGPRTHAQRQVRQQARSTPRRPTASRTTPSTTASGTTRTRERRTTQRSPDYRSRYQRRAPYRSRYQGSSTRTARPRSSTQRETTHPRESPPSTGGSTKADEAPDHGRATQPPKAPQQRHGTKRAPASHRARGLYK